MEEYKIDEFEYRLIQAIRNSADPAKAMVIAVDIMQRLIAGEDPESISASYGTKLKEVFGK